MRLLGALIAGGASRRFGSDKALAQLDGKPLLQHVLDGLRLQVETLVVCGRNWPDEVSVADKPRPDMGPLGGLNAALHHAHAEGFDAVLSAGCDVLPVPNMARLIGDRPAVVAGHHVFGFWPVALAAHLAQHLETSSNFSFKAWLAASHAQEIEYAMDFYNLNTTEDFMLYNQAQGFAA